MSNDRPKPSSTPQSEGADAGEGGKPTPVAGSLSSSDKPAVEDTPAGIEPGTLDSRG